MSDLMERKNKEQRRRRRVVRRTVDAELVGRQLPMDPAHLWTNATYYPSGETRYLHSADEKAPAPVLQQRAGSSDPIPRHPHPDPVRRSLVVIMVLFVAVWTTAGVLWWILLTT